MDDGYLVLRRVVPPPQLGELRDQVEVLIGSGDFPTNGRPTSTRCRAPCEDLSQRLGRLRPSVP